MAERENNLPESEMNPEHIPNAQEIYSVLREIKVKGFTETRRLEDEKGIYILEVVSPGKLKGETTGYEYMRKGRYPQLGEQVGASATAISVVYYENGDPVGGTTVAEYIDGNWKII